MKTAATAGVVFVLVWLCRWLVLDGSLSGDDHYSLWPAATVLKGDRTFHEFVDPGGPLHWAVSAMAQAAVGYRVIGEVVLGTTLVAVGITVSFFLAWRAGRSVVIALALTVIATLLMGTTKLYSYPKIFLYPLVLWLSWRYIDRPSLVRAIALGAGVAVAFGYRHDHGAYAAAGASAATLAAHWREGPRAAVLSLVRVGLVTIAVLSPYFAVVQANEGVIPYFRERVVLARVWDESARRTPVVVVHKTAPAWLAVAPQTPVDVSVTWAWEIAPETRAALERRYSLVPPAPPVQPGEWLNYLITDTTPASLTALAADMDAVDVDGLVGFRQGFAADTTADPVPLTVRWTERLAGERLAAVERRYRLANGRLDPADATGQMWRYDVGDSAIENLTALHEDPLVDLVVGTHEVRVPMEVTLRKELPIGPDVLLRWAPLVSEAERASLERRHGLMRGRIDEGEGESAVWQYELADRSGSNVTALATDPRVTYTDQIEPGETPGTFQARPWTPSPAYIRVRWNPGAGDAERLGLERRHHLIPERAAPGAVVTYSLTDSSPANVRALIADANVRNTSGLDREAGRVERESWFAAVRRVFPILRLRPLPKLLHRDNAGVWLFYLCVALPFVVLATLAWDRLRRRAPVLAFDDRKIFAAAALMIVVNTYLLKRLGYLADHFDVAMILAAWLLGRVVAGQRWRTAIRSSAAIAAILLFGATALSTAAYADVPALVSRYRLNQPIADQWLNNVRKFNAFATSPPIDDYAPPDVKGDRAVIRYLYECTRSDDRVWITSDEYAIPYYTERRAVGHIFWGNGFMATQEFQQRMIDLVERDQVPLIFAMGGASGLDYLAKYPLVRDYVTRRYTTQFAVPQDSQSGRSIWLLADSRRPATGYYSRLQLPCFR